MQLKLRGGGSKIIIIITLATTTTTEIEEFVNKDIIQLISNGDIQLTEDMEQLIVMSIIIIATHQILTC